MTLQPEELPSDPRWHEAVDARDPAFDGVFYVAITSTKIYCRPVCPSRTAKRENRRFFASGAAAEQRGFRACKRCRPELQHGQTPLDVVPRLAQRTLAEIAAGALDAGSVPALARALGTSERHLRRAVRRAVGVSPAKLAIAKRIEAAQTLLADVDRSITSVAYESGFQSLRRFNAAFREHLRVSPSEWRKRQRSG